MKISIITPTYNRLAFIAETIASVQASVLSPLTDVSWEHIIYDDGSTDGTAEYFSTHTFENVRYIHGEQNVGQTIAKNRAIEQAMGDYIVILDSDDVFTQRALFHFASTINANPDTKWIISEFFHTDKKLRYLSGKDYYGWSFKDPAEILKAIFNGSHHIQSNTIFSKALFTKVGGFDETIRLGEELDLYIRFLFDNEMPLYASFISLIVRLHDENSTKEIGMNEHLETIARFKEKYKNELAIR